MNPSTVYVLQLRRPTVGRTQRLSDGISPRACEIAHRRTNDFARAAGSELVGREGEDLIDRGGAGGEHDEAIEAERDPGRRGEALGEGREQALVEGVAGPAARGAEPEIVGEAGALLDGIGELVEGV